MHHIAPVIPRVDIILFTGSVPTGRRVAALAADRLASVVLELGGKDPVIVDEDVDPAAGPACGRGWSTRACRWQVPGGACVLPTDHLAGAVEVWKDAVVDFMVKGDRCCVVCRWWC